MNLRLRTLPRLIVLLAIGPASLILLGGTASANSFSSCSELSASYVNVVAKSAAAKQRFLDSYPNLPLDSVAVKPRVYTANSRLDQDRDGLLCEDDLERAARVAAAIDIFRDLLKESTPQPGVCSLRGKNLWGTVYVTDSQRLADFVIYQTTTSTSADLRVYLSSRSYLATSCGQWYLTDSPRLADFTVFVTDWRARADFSIYVTDFSYLAGLR
jgi:hypothetical protein